MGMALQAGTAQCALLYWLAICISLILALRIALPAGTAHYSTGWLCALSTGWHCALLFWLAMRIALQAGTAHYSTR